MLNDHKYILAPDGELYHAWLKKGEAAEEHKYISRVWKNGRWYYYYDSDTSAKNANKKDVRVRDVKNLFGSRTTVKTGKNSKVYETINRGKLERAVIAARKKIHDTRTGNIRDTDKLLSSRTTITSSDGTVIYERNNRGKIDRAIIAGKEYLRYLFEEG